MKPMMHDSFLEGSNSNYLLTMLSWLMILFLVLGTGYELCLMHGSIPGTINLLNIITWSGRPFDVG
jgi:hypothetical protein